MQIEVQKLSQGKSNVIPDMKNGDFAYITRKNCPYLPPKLAMRVGDMFVYFYGHGQGYGEAGWDKAATVLEKYHADEILPPGTKITITLGR